MIRNTTEALNQQFKSLKMQEDVQQIESWLAASDPSNDFQTAHAKTQAGTGLWLTESIKYIEWRLSPGTFLWAHGIRKAIFYMVNNKANECNQPVVARVY